MNTYKSISKNSLNSVDFSSLLTLAGLTCVITLLLSFPNAVKNSVLKSLTLCTGVLIPSIFPFTVIGEIFFSSGAANTLGKAIGKPFKRLFGISEAGVGAFLLGLVCGLPLGGRYALTLYSSGCISKDECERLMGLSSNAGLGFVVAGVGGIWGNMKLGWLLYLTQIISVTVVGAVLFRPKICISIAPVIVKTNKTSLSKAIVGAISSGTLNMLRACAFVVIFGVITSFIELACAFFNLPTIFLAVTSAFTEISYACSFLHTFSLTGALSGAKALTFFAVTFSGFCAHAQLSSMAVELDVGMKKYYCIRLVSAIFSAVIGSFICKLYPLYF